MLKKLGLFLITVMLLGCLGAVDASKINVDGDWRLVHIYKIADLSDGSVYTKEVAASDGHSIDIGNSHKFHQLLCQVTYRGCPHPDYHGVLINVFDGSDITLDGKISYNWRKVYYETKLEYKYGNIKGSTKNSVTI